MKLGFGISRNLLAATICLITNQAHALPNGDTEWQSFVASEKSLRSSSRFLETCISGLAIFSIGTYGANFDSQGFVTSSVYSFMQSGGIILMANSLQDHMQTNTAVALDRHFQSKNTLSREELRKITLRVNRQNEYAENISSLFMWSGLGAIYLHSGIKESKSSSTMRSLYFFLAANSALLAGASGYKLYFSNLEKTSQPPSSVSLGFANNGILVGWTKNF